MNDSELIAQIGALVEEEHRLEGHEPTGGDDSTNRRLAELEIALDQCWDLLRRRRARRDSGGNPDEVGTRAPGVVEGYQQ